MTTFRAIRSPEVRTDPRPRGRRALAAALVTISIIVGASVPASATPVAGDIILEPLTYWGDGDNVTVSEFTNAQGVRTASITSVVEVIGWPAIGQAGTVTVKTDFDIARVAGVSDYELWHSLVKDGAWIQTQAPNGLTTAKELFPVEHLFTGDRSGVEWRQDSDSAWVRFQVGPDWNRQVTVPGTGSWYGPDSGQVAPPVDESPDGITIEILDWEETVYDQSIAYSVRVTVDPAIVGAPPTTRFEVTVGPNAVPIQSTIPEQGGSVIVNGQINGITEAKARVEVWVRAENYFGGNLYDLTNRSIGLGYVNPPPDVWLTLDQWEVDGPGVWWQATIKTNSLAGAPGEVCASEFSPCRATVYAVTETGQLYTMKGLINVPRRGYGTTTVTNIGGTALPTRDYVAVFVRITGQAVYGGPILTLESPLVPVVPPLRPTYVALGDSFQSGEGTHDYTGFTNVATNDCHRSTLAYPYLLWESGEFGDDIDLEFWACSGAFARSLWDYDLVETENGYWDDPLRASWDSETRGATPERALDRLGEETAVVTLGIGGNDVGFVPVLNYCIELSAADSLSNQTPYFFMPDLSCEAALGSLVDYAITKLAVEKTWTDLIWEINRRATNAEVYVVGYPRFFPESGSSGRCQFIRPADQVWLNSEIAWLNGIIKASAEARGAHYIDIYDVGDGRELCWNGDFWLNSQSELWFMNGIDKDQVFWPPTRENLFEHESFHPNKLGHELIEAAFASQMDEPVGGWSGSVLEGETVTMTIPVTASTLLSASIVYPGSDIMITLVSPSGEVFNRSTSQSSLVEDHGGTWGFLEITEPEIGEWTVELLGLETEVGGETFTFQWNVEPLPNEPPVAVATLTQHGALVTVDGSGSYDPDGTIVEMGFDFGEGPTIPGETATHMFEQKGDVLVTMWVKDDRGEYTFTEVGTVIEIPTYTFSGFTRFANGKPIKDWAIPGHRIFLGFELGKNWGDDVMLPESPSVRQVSCTTGAPVGPSQPAVGVGGVAPHFSAKDGTYVWEWDSDPAWGGTCQELTFDFNDGSSASTTITFNPPGKAKGLSK